MKRTVLFCLCLCFCMLLSACGTPAPEQSSEPAERSETVSVPEDENAQIVRAYLDELLEGEPVAWISAAKVETIRETVKTLKTPVLTEEDVLRLAERLAVFHLALWQEGKGFSLPACGVMAAVRCDTRWLSLYSEHAEVYNALLGYALYLFTPPEYVFWGWEVWNEGWYPSGAASVDPAQALCLPFAGNYTNRLGALGEIREQQSCIRLYPLALSEGTHLLNFSYSETADLLRGGACTALELDAMAPEGFPFHELHALEYLEHLLQRCTALDDPSPPIEWLDETVCIPFFPDVARAVREMAELLPVPLLTEGDVRAMVTVLHEDVPGIRNIRERPICLPGVDGEEDVLLRPTQWSLNTRMRRGIAYTVGLFTPSACRYTDLFGRAGTYYALDGEDAGYVLVTERYELYLVDRTGGMEPLYLASGEVTE